VASLSRWAGEPAGAIDYWTLAELRYQIRRFLRVRESASRAAGVQPQQYMLLLQVRGLEGRRPATIGALAERMQVAHHSVVELVDRLAQRRLLVRRRIGVDRREVMVTLTPAGRRVVRTVARQSMSELRTEGPALVVALRRLIKERPGRRTGARRGERR
jgi:DNA-binding MarR family transcriptional regulator